MIKEESDIDPVATTQSSLGTTAAATSSEDAIQVENDNAQLLNSPNDDYQSLSLSGRLERLRCMGIGCGIHYQGLLLMVTINGTSISEDDFMQRSLESFVRSTNICEGQLKARALIDQMKRSKQLKSKF